MSTPTYAEGVVAFTALIVVSAQIIVSGVVYHDVGIEALGIILCAYANLRAAWCGWNCIRSIKWSGVI